MSTVGENAVRKESVGLQGWYVTQFELAWSRNASQRNKQLKKMF